MAKNNEQQNAAPAAQPGANPEVQSPAAASNAGRKIFVTLRHKTGYPRYRRAGLALTQKAETYEVTAEQLAALKKDKWVVIEKEEDGKK